MITTQDEKGIPDLKGPQVQCTLECSFSALIPMKEINIEADINTEISPVNIITQEKILSFCWTSFNFKQFHQVVTGRIVGKMSKLMKIGHLHKLFIEIKKVNLGYPG